MSLLGQRLAAPANTEKRSCFFEDDSVSFQDFNLDTRLYTGIQHAGYQTPTPIQNQAIPVVLNGRDLIGTAQTGTGKTAAFVLPILHRLLNNPAPRTTRVVIVAPTRELAEQINHHVRLLAHGTRIRSATVYGGVGMAPQTKALKDGTEIIVACPGRLLDHIQQGNTNLSAVETLVLDEADCMFDMGFFPAIRQILQHLPKSRQTLMFSATFQPEIEKLARETLQTPERITVGLSRPTETVQHALFPVTPHLKTPLLLALLKKTDGQSILVFTRTKHRAQRLMEQLAREGYAVTTLHGNRSQVQRQMALDGFRRGKYQVMVATDIAARGIDVQQVSHVINYDMPDTVDAYTHRIGRTGRAERTGDAFTLVTGEDADQIRTLEKLMGEKLARQTLPDFDYQALSQPRDGKQRATVAAPNGGTSQPSQNNRTAVRVPHVVTPAERQTDHPAHNHPNPTRPSGARPGGARSGGTRFRYFNKQS
jgi:ATP-dependent RNA helicase RhlE